MGAKHWSCINSWAGGYVGRPDKTKISQTKVSKVDILLK